MNRYRKRTRRTYKRKAKKTFFNRVATIVNRKMETKWREINSAPSVTNSNPTIQNLSQMITGTTRTTRIGNQIDIKVLKIRFSIRPSLTSLYGSQTRCMIVCDKQANGTTLDTQDLFQSTVPDEFLGLYNRNTVPSRYKILYDKLVWLSPSGLIGTANTSGTPVTTVTQTSYGSMRLLTKYIFLKKPIRVQFNDSPAGDETDIDKNSIWLCFFTNDASAPLIQCQTQMGFKDA